MDKKITQSPYYTELGEKIKEELFPELSEVSIIWLESERRKTSHGKIIFADCTKTTPKYEWCCDYDYMITVYQPNVAYMTDEQIAILLEHELMHVNPNGTGVVPHDVEEFEKIIRKYGLAWANPVD